MCITGQSLVRYRSVTLHVLIAGKILLCQHKKTAALLRRFLWLIARGLDFFVFATFDFKDRFHKGEFVSADFVRFPAILTVPACLCVSERVGDSVAFVIFDFQLDFAGRKPPIGQVSRIDRSHNARSASSFTHIVLSMFCFGFSKCRRAPRPFDGR